MSRDLEKSARLYRGFREDEPKRARRVNISAPKVLTVIGPVDFIGYTTSHGGKSVAYKHTFAAGSKPTMAIDPRNGKIFFVGGRYTFNSFGITDKDHRGRHLK